MSKSIRRLVALTVLTFSFVPSVAMVASASTVQHHTVRSHATGTSTPMTALVYGVGFVDPTNALGFMGGPRGGCYGNSDPTTFNPPLADPTTGVCGEVQALQDLGYTVTISDQGGTSPAWATMTHEQFASYQVIVFPDPVCQGGPNFLDAATANAISGGSWATAVNGNVIVIGTDQNFHSVFGDGSGDAPKVNYQGLSYAGSVPGKTGLFVSLGCNYEFADGSNTSFFDNLSTGLGESTPFLVNGASNCASDIHVVATTQALLGLTDANLTGWNCSVHEYFSQWPSDFIPYALYTDVQGSLGNDPCPSPVNPQDGSAAGCPYIMLRGNASFGNISLSTTALPVAVGSSQEVTASLQISGSPVAGGLVELVCANGPCSGASVVPLTTDASGSVSYTYTSTSTGTDTWYAKYFPNPTDVNTFQQSNTSDITWIYGATPSAPTIISSGATDQAVSLSWQPPNGNGYDITGYTMTATDQDGHVRTQSFPASANSGTISGLGNGTLYAVTVYATNALGGGTPTSATMLYTNVLQPTNVTALPGDSSATVSWLVSPNIPNDEPAQDYYLNVYDVTTGISSTQDCLANPDVSRTSLSCTATGLTNGHTYQFAVGVWLLDNENAVSSYSAPVLLSYGIVAPWTPSNVTVSWSSDVATVHWAPPTPAYGADPTSFTVTAYDITAGADAGLLCTYNVPTDGSKSLNTCDLQVPHPSHLYQFTVTALADSVASTPALSSITTPDVPSAPDSVTFTHTDTAATISWNASIPTFTSPVVRYLVQSNDLSRPGSYGAHTCTYTVPTDGSPVLNSCSMSNLIHGDQYVFIVTAFNELGAASIASVSSADYLLTSPQAPSAASASSTSATSMLVSWTNTSATNDVVTGYRVNGVDVTTNSHAFTACIVNSFTPGTAPGTSCSVAGLQPGDTYSFSVSATNAVGDSAWRYAPNATAGTANAPVLTAFTASATPSGVINPVSPGTDLNVTWQVPTVVPASILGYEVLLTPRGDDTVLTSTFVPPSVHQATLHIDLPVTDVQVSVAAINSYGVGQQGLATGNTGYAQPGTPMFLYVTPGDGVANLVWGAPMETGGGSLTYTIYCFRNGGLVGEYNTSNSFYQATGLTNGASYVFYVQATNGTEGSIPVQSYVVVPVGPAWAPGNVSATADVNSIHVSWSAPFNGGSAILYYEVLATPSSGEAIVKFVDPRSLSTTISGLLASESYTVTVLAETAIGQGAESAGTVLSPLSLPQTPTSLTGHGGNGQVALTWTTAVGSSSSDTFNVYVYKKGVLQQTILGITTTSTTITGLMNGTAYTFSVREVNQLGSSGARSSAAVTPANVPGSPTTVKVSIKGTSILVSWKAPKSTGGSALTGFKVYVSEGSAGTPLAKLTSKHLSGTISGLKHATNYRVYVVATNAVGESAASATLTVHIK